MSERVIHLSVTIDAEDKPIVEPHVVVVDNIPALLSFVLNSTTHKFPPDFAIQVTDPGCDFPYSSWTLGDNAVVLFDANKEAGQFSYTVTVEHKTTGVQTTFDPTIDNQAR